MLNKSMINQKVVCLVNHAAETGGAEFALERLVASLDRREWHPVVVFGEEGPAVDLMRRRSVETYVIPLEMGTGKVRRESLSRFSFLQCMQAAAAAAYTLKLRAFFRERAVSIVHTNSMKAHVVGGLAARLAGLPLVWHLRDSLHPSSLPQPALGVMRWLAGALPNRLVCVSKSVARDALGPERMQLARIVYDGLNDDCFPQAGEASTLDCGDAPRIWKVGIAGRLCAWKGQHLFLEAAAKLIEQGMRVRFEIVGGGLFGQEAYAERLKRLVDSCALREHVTFTGFVSDVPMRIRAWDVLVHASTAPDPCPNVVLEAMAAGVAVVGADAGGVPEILDEGRCGLLFQPDNPDSLSERIRSLLLDGKRRESLARAAQQRALKLFRAARVARSIETEWRHLVSASPARTPYWNWIEEGFAEATKTGGKG
jgi:glycosyltransferase involved in cell wall biosynthesis